MTPLPPHADQAVRHAVDAYIDGRLLPVFEGEGSFETRNSTYRMLDGVLLFGPNQGVVGAELVGWLIEFVARAEVLQTWRAGARAVLVDTRNDGVRGPHIIVTSATRAFRMEKLPERSSKPSLGAGPHATQGGSGEPHPWRHRSDLPPLPPVPAPGSHQRAQRAALPAYLPPPPRVPAPFAPSMSARPASVPPPPMVPRRTPATLPPPAMVVKPATLPPPPPMVISPPPMILARPATMPPPPPPRVLPRAVPPQPPVYDDGFVARRVAATVSAAVTAADDVDDFAPTARRETPSPDDIDDAASPYQPRRSTSRLAHGASIASRQIASRGFAPPPPASIPFLLSRSHQRGLPLR